MTAVPRPRGNHQATGEVRSGDAEQPSEQGKLFTYASIIGHGPSQDFEDELSRIVKSYQTGQ